MLILFVMVDNVGWSKVLPARPAALRSFIHKANRLGSAVREGQWKLIERFDNGHLEWFDVVADRSETRDVADEQPEVTRRLVSQLREWRDEVGANMPRPFKAQE